MIVVNRRQLEAICRQRGYELSSAMACVMSQDGDLWTIDEQHSAYPRRRTVQAAGEVLPHNLTRTDAPSFLTKVKNFAVASAKHVAAGMPMASDQEIIRRHDLCLACEFFADNACTKCGCSIVRAKQYVSKLSWADSECPVGKWGKERPKAEPSD